MAHQSLEALLSSWLTGPASSSTTSFKSKKAKYYTATCPDPQCRTNLYFPSTEPTVECCNCGQRHSTDKLHDRRELREKEDNFQFRQSQMKMLYGGKKTAELVKVKGISNYQCKLLSPLLTTHGRNKQGQPCTLRELDMGDVFDCSKLASRAFSIEECHLDVAGYGQDRSGSVYLQSTLNKIWEANAGRKCLIPLHADGDGHCLVHAISRCLVGRELFWHALRTNLHNHLKVHQARYAALLKDFIEDDEWPKIIEEAAPDYVPSDYHSFGLRTVHIFGLANVLRRPIVLLDNLSGMESKGDYSGIFLPSLCLPDECSTNGVLHSPIAIAWSNSGYNHFIPLVPVRDRPLPCLPLFLQPKVWGLDDALLFSYVQLNSEGSYELCRGKLMQDSYLQKLILCMEQLFYQQHSVTPALVSDVNQHVYRSAGCVGVSLDTVTAATRDAVEDGRLWKCLTCAAVSITPDDWFTPGGTLYEIAAGEYTLEDGKRYTFPHYSVTAEYSAAKNKLFPVDVNCFHCCQVGRHLLGDGTVQYEDGDRTQNKATNSRCGCGYKHYFKGKEYDNLPEQIPLQLTWKGQVIQIKVHWFQYESDQSLNSNAYEEGSRLVAENFPGEFGSEQLVQQVVEMILAATEKKQSLQQEKHQPPATDMATSDPAAGGSIIKSIATGHKSRTMHKEELGVSETERRMKKRIEENARLQQRKKSAMIDAAGTRDRPSAAAPSSPPSKVAASVSTADRKPSPSSPNKRIRVTLSDGKAANLVLSSSATYTDLLQMIEEQLGVPTNQQRLLSGFPPRELVPPEDPSAPLPLSNGERVSVQFVGGSQPMATDDSTATSVRGDAASLPKSAPSVPALDASSLFNSSDQFDQLQYYGHLFKKGGSCYEEVVRTHGNNLTDNMHLQFQEIKNAIFRFNKREERLELCLGVEHVPVGPLTPQQKELCRLAAAGKSTTASSSGEEVHNIKWLVNKPSASGVKAFSGTGHTLGGSGGSSSSGATASAASKPHTHQQGQAMSNYSTLLEAAQMILSTRLQILQGREQELQTEIRTLNRRLAEANARNNGAQEEGMTALETKLLDMSSELKQVREEIRELSSL